MLEQLLASKFKDIFSIAPITITTFFVEWENLANSY